MRTPSRILIVDDMAANVHILQLRLTAQGYDVLTANDGEAELEDVNVPRHVVHDEDPRRRSHGARLPRLYPRYSRILVRSWRGTKGLVT